MALVPFGILAVIHFNTAIGSITLLAGLVAAWKTWRVYRYFWTVRRSLISPARVRLTNESIECYEKDFDVTLDLPWPTFTNMERGHEFWFLRKADGWTLYLPRRVFDTDQQAAIDRFIADKTRTSPAA
ncbi:hypothetical protein ACIBH1_26805 [Nonomuraea sp. NPDC050663]|uniref:hypothetical protein n=1 Tax=Nonomuraea sp. NPDC050663 TaxID=3364370 RepID=UPI0037AEE2A2